MGPICMVQDLMAELVMGRVCYGPSLSWFEFVMGREVPESSYRLYVHVFDELTKGIKCKLI